MLGSEPIIWDESIGICVQSDVADEVPERLRRSPVELAAIHVNNRGPLSGLRRLSPPTGHPSNGRGSKSHALWDRDLLHDAVERTAASGPFDLAFHMRDNRSQSGHPDRIFLANRMYHQPGCSCACAFQDVRLNCSLLSNHISRRTESALKKI